MIDKKTKEAIANSLKTGNTLNMRLGKNIRFKIERRLPFLLVYRHREDGNNPISGLVVTESSYLIADSSTDNNRDDRGNLGR